jgi:hypothetical protein
LGFGDIVRQSVRTRHYRWQTLPFDKPDRLRLERLARRSENKTKGGSFHDNAGISSGNTDDARRAMCPGEIVGQLPTLTLSDVHSALAYYYDHMDEIQEDIRQNAEVAEQLRARFPSSLSRK